MRSLLAIGVVAVIAVLLWWVLTLDPAPPPAGPDRTGTPDSAAGPQGIDDPAKTAGAAAVRGRVWRNGQGAPARVEVRRRIAGYDRLVSPFGAGEAVASADTDAEGRFHVPGLSEGAWEVTARAEGGYGRVFVKIPSANAVARADLQLRGGSHSLRGRLLRADGGPFRGMVWALPDPWPRRSQGAEHASPTVHTDADGRFVLESLPAGAVTLHVLDPGRFHTAFPNIPVPQPGELVITLMEGFTEVTGRVVALDGGSMLPGARVAASGRAGRRIVNLGTVTDDDGGFRLLAPEGTLSYTVEAEGFVPLREQRSSREGLTFRLHAFCRVFGRVIAEPGGEPVAGVPVHSTSVDTSGRHRIATETKSSADGRYELTSVPPGEMLVYAAGHGWVSKGLVRSGESEYFPMAVVVPRGGEVERDLPVVRAARASGRVLDAEGRGLAGVPVRADPISGLPHRPVSATGPDGSFRIDSLVPGLAYRFTAERGRLSATEGPFVARTDEDTEVVLTLGTPRRLEIRVVGGEGDEAVPDAVVMLSRSSERWTTDADGRARAGPVGAGKLSVWVGHPDYVRGRRWLPVPGSESEEDPPPMTVRLRPAREIAGRVVLPHGAPLTAGSASAIGGRRLSAATMIRPDGTFRMGGLAAGTYKVVALGRAEGREWAAEATVEAGTTDALLTARDLGEQRVTTRQMTVVVTDEEGRPVVGGRAETVGGFSGMGKKLVEGRAELRAIGIGKGEAYIEVTGARDQGGQRLARTRHGPIDPAADEVTICLKPGRSLAGVVREVGGDPVVGIRVRAQVDGSWLGTALTDQEGKFRITGLGGEEVRLSLVTPAHYHRVEHVTARVGRTDLVFELTPAATALVTVLGPEGRPVMEAQVEVSAPSRKVRRGGVTTFHSPGRQRAKTDAAGTVRLGGLDPDGEYGLEVTPPRNRSDLAEARIKEWRPADVVVRMELGLAVAGHVRFEPDRSLGRVQLWCQSAGGQIQIEDLPKGGAFRFDKLSPGPVTLYIRTDGSVGFPYRLHQFTTRAGTRDVEYVIPLGHRLEIELGGWPGGDPVGQWVEILPEGGDPEDSRRIVRARVEPVLRFEGLEEGETYSLQISGVAGRLCARRSGIPADAGRITLPLAEGLTIRGTLKGPAGLKRCYVRVFRKGVSVRAKVGSEGSFEIGGLLPGTWTLNASVTDNDGAEWGGQCEVQAGAEVVLPLTTGEE